MAYSKEKVETVYNQVLKDVKSGQTINKSLRRVGFYRATFYRLITDEQKRLLEVERAINTKATHPRGGYGLNAEKLKDLLSYQIYK